MSSLENIKKVSKDFKRLRQNLGIEIATATYLYKLRKKIASLAKGNKKASNTVDALFYHYFGYLIPIHPLIDPAKKRSVNLFVPNLKKSSVFGGVATAIIFSLYLARDLNADLRFVAIDDDSDISNLKDFISVYSLDPNFNEVNVSIEILHTRSTHKQTNFIMSPNDINVATTWWSAHLINQMQPDKKFVYMIQEYEPIFYPNSDTSMLAEETYRLKNIIPVVNSEILYNYLISEGYKVIENAGTYFQPALLKKIFETKRETGKGTDKRNLFFYARPSIGRNLFFIGLKSIEKAFKDGILNKDEWRLLCAGEGFQKVEILPGLYTESLGKMSIDKYLELLKTVDLGISLMAAPHPSYPPLELAASGAVVISTKYKGKVDLSKYSKNILLADSSVDSIVKEIKNFKEMSKDTIKNNYKTSDFLSDWDVSFNKVIPEVVKRI